MRMMMMASSYLWLAVVTLPAMAASAQSDLKQQILSTVIYTLHGDRTPWIWPQAPVLTPLGAEQLYNTGQSIRERYILPSTDSVIDSTRILNISPYQLFLNDLDILTTDDQFVAASAQAFMQGLYPPIVGDSGYTVISGQSELANGSNVVAPLDGYQYPNIYTASDLDLNYIWVAGNGNCPTYTTSVNEYLESAEYSSIEHSSQSFYSGLEPQILDGIFPTAGVGYADAYYIWDYLNYASTHNATAAELISPDQLTQARNLVDQWVYSIYGDLSASGTTPGDHIRAIAGRTLASRVLEAFYFNVNTQGAYRKMNLLFGGYEPMISFAALAQLSSSETPDFRRLPDFASSMVFELFSLFIEENGSYPDPSNLYVRFLFQNASEENSQLVGYPLFGRDESQIVMTLPDFVSGMESFMMSGVAEWCSTCNSYSVFCPAFDQEGDGTVPGLSAKSNHGMHPAVAGVIGAVVALAFIGLLLAAAMLIGGLRFFRKRTSKRSELGGFKGAEKLGSDQDLSIAKGNIDSTAGGTAAAAAMGRSHERVGSWELREQAKAEEGQLPTMASPAYVVRRPSYEDDDLRVNPFGSPVKPRDHI